MRIKKLNLYHLRIPLRFRFAQSNNPSSTFSDTALLGLETTDGIGSFGEACPRRYVTGEDIKMVQQDLERCERELFGADFDSLNDIKALLRGFPEQGIGPSARCAIELALIDLLCKSQGKSLGQIFDIPNPKVLSYSLILPLIPAQKLGRFLQKIPPLRPPAIKIKVTDDLENALACIRTLKAHFGKDIPIRVDVNGGWTINQAMDQIPVYLKEEVRSFEQPLAAGELNGFRQLTSTFGNEASIMADESLLNLEGAKRLLEIGACNHFNLKISKLGGIFAALDISNYANQQGIPCQMGAHFGETSILAAAGITLASKVEGLTNCEGAICGLLLEEDISSISIQHQIDGTLDTRSGLETIGWAGAYKKEVIKNWGTLLKTSSK